MRLYEKQHDQRRRHIPYDENRREHQEPVTPISEWQEWNDMTSWEEEELKRAQKYEAMRRECQEGMK